MPALLLTTSLSGNGKPEMTILSMVYTKLLCTNAHLGGRRVDAHHFQVYICGSRNGIAILDSDKTLICLRTALHFIGSPIRQKCRSFLLKTNHLFRYEILEEMASCINDSQWKIGTFFSNYLANKIKFRLRTKKINFGLNQQPDCAVILNADRKSSVILEADRSQIPIAFLVDSTIPWESHKRITYPIPANDPIQFVYLFRHSVTKTGILERKRITAMNVDGLAPTLRASGMRTYSSSSSSPRPRSRGQRLPFYLLGSKFSPLLFCLFMKIATVAAIWFLARWQAFFPEVIEMEMITELAAGSLTWLGFFLANLWEIFVQRMGRGCLATLGGMSPGSGSVDRCVGPANWIWME